MSDWYATCDCPISPCRHDLAAAEQWPDDEPDAYDRGEERAAVTITRLRCDSASPRHALPCQLRPNHESHHRHGDVFWDERCPCKVPSEVHSVASHGRSKR